MSKARLVITAVVIQNRPVAQVAAEYGVSRSWLYELLARYRKEGEAAFQPRSRRPKRIPKATAEDVVELIVELREKLTATGLDSGPDTIRWHLEHQHGLKVGRTTISRHLQARGLVVPEPKKRPKSTYIRFAAELPNECCQSDFTANSSASSSSTHPSATKAPDAHPDPHAENKDGRTHHYWVRPSAMS